MRHVAGAAVSHLAYAVGLLAAFCWARRAALERDHASTIVRTGLGGDGPVPTLPAPGGLRQG